MTEELTKVELTEEEAKTFINFQKHRALIGLLDSVGFFNMESGSITLHVNHLGQIQSVEKREFFNSRGL